MNKNRVLFSNETEVNQSNLISMMFYKRFFYQWYITTIKLFMCTFIIIASTKIDMNSMDRKFCIIMAVLGIVDVFMVKRIKNKKVLKYEFFDNYFQVNNNKMLIEIDYDCIERVIEKEKYYYLIIKKSIMMISKDGFKIGNKKEIKDFIEEKMKNPVCEV